MMMHYYILAVEARQRREDAQRARDRRELVRLAQANGNYEESGLLPALSQWLARFRRPKQPRQAVTISPARSTAT